MGFSGEVSRGYVYRTDYFTIEHRSTAAGLLFVLDDAREHRADYRPRLGS